MVNGRLTTGERREEEEEEAPLPSPPSIVVGGGDAVGHLITVVLVRCLFL